MQMTKGMIILLVCFIATFTGMASAAGVRDNLKSRLDSDLQHIKTTVANNVDFLLLDGASNANDAAQVAAFLGSDQKLDADISRDIRSTFCSNLKKPTCFRAFPYRIPRGPSEKPRNICIIKFDYSTPYTLDRLLRMLKTSRAVVSARGIDLHSVSADRLLMHIWHHEIWHCLDVLSGNSESYAFKLDNTSYPLDTLFAAYIRFSEIGADVFASILDIQAYGDTEVSELIAYVRQQNLRMEGLDHYTSPAIMEVVRERKKFRHYSLKQVVVATDLIRRKYTSDLDRFAMMKEAYDPMDREEGPIVIEPRLPEIIE